MNSIIRVNSEDTQDGYVQLPRPVSNGSKVSYIVNWTQSNYNVVTNSNFSVNGVIQVVPAGYYSQQAICSYLTTAFAAVPGFSMQPNTYSKLVTVQATGVFTIEGADCNQRLLDLIGLEAILYSGASIYTATSVGSGGYKGCGMSLMIDGIQNEQIGTVAKRNNHSRLFIPYNAFGTTSEYMTQYPLTWCIQTDKEIYALRIYFLDFYGEEVDFNGGSWVVQICLSGNLRNSYTPENYIEY